MLYRSSKDFKIYYKKGFIREYIFWGVISYWGNNCILIITKFDKLCKSKFIIYLKIKKSLLYRSSKDSKIYYKKGFIREYIFWGVISYWGNNCTLIITKFDKLCKNNFIIYLKILKEYKLEGSIYTLFLHIRKLYCSQICEELMKLSNTNKY